MLGISNKLAFARELPGYSLPVTVATSDVNMFISRPQSLFARVILPRFQVLYSVVHGPDASYTAAYVEDFWTVVLSDLTKCRRASENITMVVDSS